MGGHTKPEQLLLSSILNWLVHLFIPFLIFCNYFFTVLIYFRSIVKSLPLKKKGQKLSFFYLLFLYFPLGKVVAIYIFKILFIHLSCESWGCFETNFGVCRLSLTTFERDVVFNKDLSFILHSTYRSHQLGDKKKKKKQNLLHLLTDNNLPGQTKHAGCQFSSNCWIIIIKLYTCMRLNRYDSPIMDL